jgi:hypothetical protein
MSLLEIVLSMTLLVVVVPTIFALFFTNAGLSQKLSLDVEMEDVADDVKSFVKLSNYDYISELAKNNATIAVCETEEDCGICARKFEKMESFPSADDCNFVAKFEFADCDCADETALAGAVSETCAIPLRCEILHVKAKKRAVTTEKLPMVVDATHAMFLVKNR